MTRSKRIGAASLGVLGILALGAAAWACTVQPMVLGVTPMIVSPGEQVQVEGTGVASASPVELHWNSAAGPVIAAGSPEAGKLSMTATVPDAAPGIYTLVLVTPDSGIGRAVVQVVPGDSNTAVGGTAKLNAVSDNLWNGFTSDGRASSPLGLPASDTASPKQMSRALGSTLLAVGAVSMLSVFAAAAVRRRAKPRAKS